MNRSTNKTRIQLAVLLALTVIFLILSILAPLFMPNDPNHVNLADAKQAPNEAYPWGTDWLGRCVFSRVLAAAPVSVFSALVIVGLTLMAGSAVGIACGYWGGKLDSILMRIVDIFLAFPGMVLALAVAGLLGKGLNNAVIALVATGWPPYARLMRGQVLTLKEKNFVHAAKLNGQTTVSILFLHILPNALRPIVVTASLSIGGTILSLAGLSFLGLGPQPPLAEWGSMIADGRGLMQQHPWIVLYPGLAILLTSILFNLLGDSVRDALDPHDSHNFFQKTKRKRNL